MIATKVNGSAIGLKTINIKMGYSPFSAPSSCEANAKHAQVPIGSKAKPDRAFESRLAKKGLSAGFFKALKSCHAAFPKSKKVTISKKNWPVR
jgi:hypothetical protein